MGARAMGPQAVPPVPTSIRHIWRPGVVLLSVLETLVLSSTMVTGAAGKGTCRGIGNTLVNGRRCH